jgi:hypothetical protein
MNLADVFTVVLVILGFQVVFIGIWLMSAGLCSSLVDRCAVRMGTTPVVCAIVGLACMVPLIAAGVVIGQVATNAPGKILSVLVFVFTLLAALCGTAGLALRIGQGLQAGRDQIDPWRRVLRGAIVLALTYLTIVMIPLTLIPGFGALVLASFGKNPAADPAAPAPL